MSTSHGVEDMEGIRHLGSFSKHSFQGPDLDLLNQKGEGLRDKGQVENRIVCAF